MRALTLLAVSLLIALREAPALAAPEVRIAAPVHMSFVRATVHVDARCPSCTSLEVRLGAPTGPLLASATTTMDRFVDVSSMDHKEARLYVVGVDGAGVSMESVVVYPESSTRLVEVSGGEGQLSRMDPDRMIFMSGPPAVAVLRDRASGVERVVDSTAQLTSRGAIWRGGEWRDGISIPNAATRDWSTAGRWASWSTTKIGPDWPLCNGTCSTFLLDVETGTTTTILSGGPAMAAVDVAANGDALVLWIPPLISGRERLYRVRGGVAESISGGGSSGGLTDGESIVYTTTNLSTRYNIHVRLPDGTKEHLSDLDLGGDSSRDYAIANGWVAYRTASPANGPRSVWLRSPSGTHTQVSATTPARLDALGDNGDVVVAESAGRTLVSASGGTPESLPWRGNHLFFGGLWHIALGGSDLRRIPPGGSLEPDLVVSRGAVLVPSGGSASVRPLSAGGAPLAVGAVTIEGPDAASFSIGSNTCSGHAVAPGAACLVRVTTAASTSTAAEASLVVTSSDADEPARRVRLQVVPSAVAPAAPPSSGPDGGAADPATSPPAAGDDQPPVSPPSNRGAESHEGPTTDEARASCSMAPHGGSRAVSLAGLGFVLLLYANRRRSIGMVRKAPPARRRLETSRSRESDAASEPAACADAKD